MACCGQQRAALRQTSTPPHPAGSSVYLRFTQSSAVLVRGPVTGRHYQFNGSEAAQSIDHRDAAALIQSGYFRPVQGDQK